MTINSDIDIHLGKVPDVDDPSLYEALLAVHNALEILLTEIQEARDRELVVSSILVSDYSVGSLDNLILTDTTTGNVNITLPDPTLVSGRRFTVKQTAGANTTVVSVDGGATIDGAASTNITLLATKTFASNGVEYFIL